MAAEPPSSPGDVVTDPAESSFVAVVAEDPSSSPIEVDVGSSEPNSPLLEVGLGFFDADKDLDVLEEIPLSLPFVDFRRLLVTEASDFESFETGLVEDTAEADLDEIDLVTDDLDERSVVELLRAPLPFVEVVEDCVVSFLQAIPMQTFEDDGEDCTGFKTDDAFFPVEVEDFAVICLFELLGEVVVDFLFVLVGELFTITLGVVAWTLGVVVVFGVVFGWAIFGVVLTTLTTGNCKADFMASDDCEIYLHAAESSSALRPCKGEAVCFLENNSQLRSACGSVRTYPLSHVWQRSGCDRELNLTKAISALLHALQLSVCCT